MRHNTPPLRLTAGLSPTLLVLPLNIFVFRTKSDYPRATKTRQSKRFVELRFMVIARSRRFLGDAANCKITACLLTPFKYQ
jgi:hypothetical protein